MSDQKAKYMIHASIKADGTIQRKDVVGAIFGQTEGLLGEELQLRKLQRTGRIGHVDVNLKSRYLARFCYPAASTKYLLQLLELRLKQLSELDHVRQQSK